MLTEFQAAIAQLIHEKGLPQERVIEAIANALLAAYRKGSGGGENIRVEVEANGKVHVWENRRVVAQAQDCGAAARAHAPPARWSGVPRSTTRPADRPYS